MPSTVEQLSPSRVKLTIELPFADLQPHIDKAYQDIAKQVSLPGFRKGRVPAAVIDQRFGRGVVLQEAINEALPEAYGKAVTDNKLVPLSQPEVEVTKLEDGDLVEFTAEVDIRPEFELPDLSTVKATVPTLTVTESDLDDQLNVLRERFVTTSDVDRAAAEGDGVVIDLEARRDGEVVDGGSQTGANYTIGSGAMLEGLDEAVIGLKAGDTKTFTTTLMGAHRGEEAEVTVTVTKVQERKLPEVDDEFAQMVSEFDTADEMREDLRNGLTNYMRIDQANAARDMVLADLLEKVDFELPTGLVEGEVDARRRQVNEQLGQLGLTVESYLKENPDEDAEDEDDFWAKIEKRTLDALKAQVLLDKLADDDEIGVDQNDLTQLLFRKAQENGTSPEQEAQHMMEHNHMAEWMQEVRRNKALTKIVQSATITDEAGETIDLSKVMADGSLRPDDAPEETSEETNAKAAAEATEPTTTDDAAAEEAPAEEAPKKAPRKKRSDAAS